VPAHFLFFMVVAAIMRATTLLGGISIGAAGAQMEVARPAIRGREGTRPWVLAAPEEKRGGGSAAVARGSGGAGRGLDRNVCPTNSTGEVEGVFGLASKTAKVQFRMGFL
jgi:hypothetical protein